ncbi:hypothetical protein GCM10009557_49070 [Virgisporangium ochraceum]
MQLWPPSKHDISANRGGHTCKIGAGFDNGARFDNGAGFDNGARFDNGAGFDNGARFDNGASTKHY